MDEAMRPKTRLRETGASVKPEDNIAPLFLVKGLLFPAKDNSHARV